MSDIEANTPYDDVCRTLAVECDDLVIPLVNEIFGENFSPDAQIIRCGNEHFEEQQGGAEQKRVTDSLMNVIDQPEEHRKKLHIECESRSYDGTILIRIFEYASQIALDDGSVRDMTLHVDFPHSAVIFLRSKKTHSGKMNIHINTPGGEVDYEIPTLHIQDYDIEDLFAKQLYFLIPFYLFNYESHFAEISADEEQLNEIKGLYRNIMERLEAAVGEGKLTEFSYLTIRDMTNRVAQNLARKYESIKKGIGDIMGGQVLDYEAKRIRDEGEKIGQQRGEQLGRNYERKSMLEQITTKTQQGQSADDILKSIMSQLQEEQ